MNEDIKTIIDYLNDLNKDSVKHLKWELEKVRASAATPSMLDSVKVEYYGTITPINQVASITTPDSRTITVQPWEKNMLVEISKSIINSNIGLNPQNNGDKLIIDVPPLTESRRKGRRLTDELAKFRLSDVSKSFYCLMTSLRYNTKKTFGFLYYFK